MIFNKYCYKDSYFWLGITIRLLLICFAIPVTYSAWFVPFLEHTVFHPSLNPWGSYLNSGGNVLAFPYGTVMLLAYLPAAILGVASSLLTTSSYGVYVAIGLTSLVFDIALMQILLYLTNTKERQILKYYWLSPIVIYICYWHGQLDILPTTLMISSLYLLKLGKPRLSGSLLALSVSAKLSMAIAAPVLLIYLWRNNRVRYLFKDFLISATIVFAIFQLPYFLTPGFDRLVFANPEFSKIASLAINFGKNISLYIFPIAYALFIYCLWRFERVSFELLCALLGVGFLLVLIFTPASVGWYMWIIPFLVIHQVKHSSFVENLIILSFGIIFIAYSLVQQTGSYIVGFDFNFSQSLSSKLPAVFHTLNFSSWAATLLAMIPSVICLSAFNKGVRNNDYFRLSRKPLAIGIAGDSGTGKDTLSAAIANLFNLDAVASVSGDDYHKWDRYSPMWKSLTHLDPRANNLAQFFRDIIKLLSGKSIVSRHYDHHTGRFTRTFSINKNDVIVISGLHALYIPALRKNLDVKIFLKMDEELRQFFKLRRDVYVRGHSEETVRKSIEKRLADATNYLLPQMEYADLVFVLEPVNRSLLKDYRYDKNILLRLKITVRDSFYYDEIIRCLIGICGIQVDTSFSNNGDCIEIIVDGEVSAADIKMVAEMVVPHMDELLAHHPQWQAGMTGIMQLFTLRHIAEALHARLT